METVWHSCKQVIHKKTLESSRHVDRVLKNLFVLSAVVEPLLRKKAKKLHVLLQSHPEAMSAQKSLWNSLNLCEKKVLLHALFALKNGVMGLHTRAELQVPTP
ncbi:hypothetical protein CEUSTIGMA_g6431.t1 [Chlamydomonas eustigma]|uniref:Uncharacterized protein n=1 Tax=Chlamydomonas eustigma TaxID=1157962 RepID=A0A250X7C9_9CHLO|nr:hypothetical protein CEUSTIGMA_g6431.t1 [Chlamydomonas eustigma]|eukprot:GAX78991.1 hypothetical protein CEUSTIGMA_g6431.t1 [Chlamydomonas eustigma]